MLTTVYEHKAGEDFLKAYSQAGYADYATRVIMQLFGDSKLTRFELFQTIHNNLGHLKHIVYNRTTCTYRFIFKAPIEVSIEVAHV